MLLAKWERPLCGPQPKQTPLPACATRVLRERPAFPGRQKVVAPMTDADHDLIAMCREELLDQGIRTHRDATGHDLCRHHPGLWSLLSEPVTSDIAVPRWAEFMRGCIRYRASLDQRPRQADPSPIR